MEGRKHPIVVDEERCIGCVSCGRVCPTRALRIRNDVVTQVEAERCIDCGACIKACKRGALRPRTASSADLERYKLRVAVPSLVLYGQFGHDVRPGQILHAFRAIGFDMALDISWTCEMVASAIDAYLMDCRGPWPKISMTCPAVLRLIQLEYPSLIPHIIPVDTPRELVAKFHRRRLAADHGIEPADVGLFYISPCSALIDAIEHPFGRGSSHLDGAFSIKELYGPLLRAIQREPEGDTGDVVSTRGLRWVLASGQIPGMRNTNSITVKGLRDVTYVLDSMERGALGTVDFINAYICDDGCFSGQLTIAGRYLAQRYLSQVVRKLGESAPYKEERFRALLQSHFFDLDAPIEPRAPSTVASDLRGAAEKQARQKELELALPGKNCGACGAPDCAALAEDVIAGACQMRQCPFVRIEQLERDNAALRATPRAAAGSLSVRCPRCGQLLSQGGEIELRVAVGRGGGQGTLRTPAALGRTAIALEPELPHGSAFDCCCTACGLSVMGERPCGACGAPTASLRLAVGGSLELCTRTECGHRELSGVTSKEQLLALVDAASDVALRKS